MTKQKAIVVIGSLRVKPVLAASNITYLHVQRLNKTEPRLRGVCVVVCVCGGGGRGGGGGGGGGQCCYRCPHLKVYQSRLNLIFFFLENKI